MFRKIEIPSTWKEEYTKYPNGKTIWEALSAAMTSFNNFVDEVNGEVQEGLLAIDQAEETLRGELTTLFTDLSTDFALDFSALQDEVDAAVASVADKVTQAQLDAVSAQLAETGQRIDNIVTTPVPTGEIIAEEIIDARQGKGSLASNISVIKSQLAEIENGNFKLNNNIVNGDLSNGTSGYVAEPPSTLSVVDKRLLMTAGGNQFPYFTKNTAITAISGHKIYINVPMKMKNAESTVMQLRVTGTIGGALYVLAQQSTPQIDRQYNLKGIFTVTDQTGLIKLRPSCNYPSAEIATGKVMEVDGNLGIYAIDLTEIFGVGNEPTIEEFEELLLKYGDWFGGEAELNEKKQVDWLLKSDTKIKKLNNHVKVHTYDTPSGFRKIPIFYWHEISSEFEYTVAFLKHYGFSFISVSDLYEYMQGRKVLPKKPCILQFDDGASSVYTVAKPVLQAYNIKATLYVCSYGVENQSAPPGDPGRTWTHMTWAQIQEMHNLGLIDVQSHGHAHYPMATRTLSQNETDIDTAYDLINTRLTGVNVEHFSYPNSSYNQEVMDLIEKKGYKTGRAGGDQSLGFTNVLQTGMYNTFYENPYALKVLWKLEDIIPDQFNDRVCPNDNVVADLEYKGMTGNVILGWNSVLDTGTVTFPNEGVGGGVCAKISKPVANGITHHISRNIPVKFMDRFGINFDVKTSGVTDFRVVVYYYKADGTVLKTANLVTVNSTIANYENKENMFFIDDQKIAYIDVRCQLYSIGTAWVDNLKLLRRVADWR